jgi:nitroreductase
MEFQRVVDRRRMVRNFTTEPVAAKSRDRILANALHAPSAGFSQGWAFLVLEEPAERARFWAATGAQEADNPWLAGMQRAPLLIVAWSNKSAYLDRYAEADKGWTDRDEGRWPVPYWHVDTGMAALMMLLTSVDLGLAACLFGVPPEFIGSLRAAFDVPNSFDVVGVVAVGHGAPDRPSPSLRRGRRPVEEVVHTGRW